MDVRRKPKTMGHPSLHVRLDNVYLLFTKTNVDKANYSRCIVMIAVTGGLLALGSVSLRHRKIDTSILGFWSLGFGALTPFTYIVLNLPRQDPAGLISNVLIANLPQLLISIVYIFYNAMLSTFLVQREFSLMYKAERRKPLRVSEPMGIQRSSYFISLPLRYGIPLYATAGLMHWLISQSLFLARITAIDPDGQDDSTYSFSTCGYSPFAIFISKRKPIPCSASYTQNYCRGDS
jgi:hypothetical protein